MLPSPSKHTLWAIRLLLLNLGRMQRSSEGALENTQAWVLPRRDPDTSGLGRGLETGMLESCPR